MTRNDILSRLSALKTEARSRYRIRELALFGSVVRGEHTGSSDIDVLADFEDNATLFDFAGLALFLEEHLGCAVDVVPRRALREELRETVLKEAVTV